jgi:hypothetical protein
MVCRMRYYAHTAEDEHGNRLPKSDGQLLNSQKITLNSAALVAPILAAASTGLTAAHSSGRNLRVGPYLTNPGE